VRFVLIDEVRLKARALVEALRLAVYA